MCCSTSYLPLADRAEGITDTGARNKRGLCCSKSGDEAQETSVVLIRVKAHDGDEGTELEATVREDYFEKYAEISVEGKEVFGYRGRLSQAIETRRRSLPEPISEARRVWA